MNDEKKLSVRVCGVERCENAELYAELAAAAEGRMVENTAMQAARILPKR